MNQCDGCRAGKPLIRTIGGEWYADPTGTVHIMGYHQVAPDGLVTVLGYADLMSCTRHLYEVQEQT